MSICFVCHEPPGTRESMQRDCCSRGFVHLSCIQDRDLEICRFCEEDPYRVFLKGGGFSHLRPVDAGKISPLHRINITVEQATRNLKAWEDVICRAIQNMQLTCSESVLINRVEMGVTYSNGTKEDDKTGFVAQHYVQLTKKALKNLHRWAGCLGSCSGFDSTSLKYYKLDHIVEMYIRFRYKQYTHHLKGTKRPLRPFGFQIVSHELGTWDCFLILSGCTPEKPTAKRVLTVERK